MDLLDRLQFFDLRDGVALALIALCWVAIGLAVEHGLGQRRSVSQLMNRYRREWLHAFVSRQPRILDGAILNGLRQGTTFFASASMIAIGGGLALIGNTERLLAVAEDLSLEAPALVWEVKILLILFFLANAFLKFVWSHRLFGYCAVVMAAVPNDESEPAYARAAQAAELNISAARAYNRGLRAVYFALAACGWLLGPWALIGATLLTLAVLWRREFASHSRTVLLVGDTK
ncbi:hypothetical protein AIOL_001028 [Candidatus Rhodobacter oscarellae]|uniref:DUF599 domain-containing protein n=1 Tax=Candidatus Rhodobacter oscarellae TaxID=1675527 RepID=A0A0J9DZG1_9RHOB|nr:DUF599 domain-containing protein [Candidatus Rhodobacter lobularis]KMW56076.1 hypothetical protein AIOL_001028 [Candidatus Rhodobacter lobularis]